MKLLANFLHDEQLGNVCYATPIYGSTLDGKIIARASLDDSHLNILKDWEELEIFDTKENELNQRILGHVHGDGIVQIGIEIDDDKHIFLRTLKCVLSEGNLCIIDQHKGLMKHKERKIHYKKIDLIFLFD